MGDLLIEGGTLAYLIRIGGRQILAFGSMNYIEREIDGLVEREIDFAVVPQEQRYLGCFAMRASSFAIET